MSSYSEAHQPDLLEVRPSNYGLPHNSLVQGLQSRYIDTEVLIPFLEGLYPQQRGIRWEIIWKLEYHVVMLPMALREDQIRWLQTATVETRRVRGEAELAMRRAQRRAAREQREAEAEAARVAAQNQGYHH